jgi:thioredoxin 1
VEEKLKTLTNENFHNEIKSGITVVDFWAPWCGPCRMIAPLVEELDVEMEDINFAKLNVDDAQEIAVQFGVMSIPTLIFFKDGEKKDSVVGVVPKDNIKSIIEAIQ